MPRPPSSRDRVLGELDRRDGYLRHRDLLDAGIDPHVLGTMVAAGDLERVRRGLYRRAGQWSEHTALAVVRTAAPDAVVCLLSALDYYHLTTATPSEVYLAVSRKSRPPHIYYPPVRVLRYGERMFSYGVTMQPISEGGEVRMYSREKTLADAFHFSSVVGQDVAVEALRSYLRQPGRNLDGLLEAASVCRVQDIIRSYLEALL